MTSQVLSSPHDYGFEPSKQGLINFDRDTSIAKVMPYYKQVVRAESHGPKRKIHYIIQILTPMLLLGGILMAALAFYESIRASSGYGLQSIIVDSNEGPVTDPAAYQFNASTRATVQQWAMRAGENGRNFTVTLNLPDPATMVNNALVYVRNTSTETYDANNTPPTINPFVPSINVTVPGSPPIVLGARQNIVLIATKDTSGIPGVSGIPRWYNALLMPGAV